MPRLTLLRHGESAWNPARRLAGWFDVPLTAVGAEAAAVAGRLMGEQGATFDLCFTSLQTRAIQTLHLALEALDRLWLPVEKDWRLNERHYGALTGIDRAEAAARHGEADARAWLKTFDGRPPPLDASSPYAVSGDARYAGLTVPGSESLADTSERVIACWRERIAPHVAAGRQVLVCAHGNSVGALIKHLSRTPDQATASIEVPAATPIVVELDAT